MSTLALMDRLVTGPAKSLVVDLAFLIEASPTHNRMINGHNGCTLSVCSTRLSMRMSYQRKC
jgi:hypothetical protein